MKTKDLAAVQIRAKGILSQLKQKYPTLDAYLVYSSRLGQTDVGSSSKIMLSEFPTMFIDSNAKTKALELKEKCRAYERDKKDIREIERELDSLIQDLNVVEDTQVELRFGQLRYELVWQLQTDELVDKARTPQSKSSIRIVLGTIGEMSEGNIA